MKSKVYLLNFALIAATAASTYLVTPLISNTVTAQQGAQSAPQAKADNEYQMGGVLYMQKSAEYRALAYQAFNWAKITLDGDDKAKKKLPKTERRMPRAVVVDIDETVLDNSPAQAQLIKNREPFSVTGNWYPWGEMRKAKAIPGSVDFLNYAVSKGAKVFFVSNRDEVQKQATMDNLKNAGFQGVTDETVLLRQPREIGKETRRIAIAKNYRVVIFMGDNLDDMSNLFEGKTIAERFAQTDSWRAQWGGKYIALPNAIYGTWENAIYDYQHLNDAQKAEKRVNALELP
jgi:5'-nucleotidase (lipoprotein e(P4) family)